MECGARHHLGQLVVGLRAQDDVDEGRAGQDFRALGLRGADEIIRAFYSVDKLLLRQGTIYWTVNDSLVGLRAARDIVVPGENFTVQSGKKITANGLAALRKANVKSIAVSDEALEGAFAAADIVDPETGEVILEANDELTPRVISMANQKGGVAKTTSTVNLAAALKERGKRVLVVDLDPQSNLTMSFGIDPEYLEKSMFDVLVHRLPIREVIHEREVDVAASSIDLAGAEIELVSVVAREGRLRKAILAHPWVGKDAGEDRFDYVLIDCPPSLSLLTLNGLCAAHGVIVPMQCEYFALEGLTDLVNTIKQVHANLNKELKIIALLRVMFDPRVALSQQVSRQLEAHFGDKVFRTLVPRNVRLAEAPSHGLPALIYDHNCAGSRSYIALARELIGRMPERRKAA
mgnify:CR=1 FL=1